MTIAPSPGQAPAAAGPGSALLSVVVLSYDRPAYLRRALASVTAQPVAPREIIVVDNPSGASAEVARVVAEFPEARLHAPPANLGFTGGMNLGLSLAAGRHVLITEDDIVLEPGCLQALLAHARSRPDAGVLSAVMLDAGSGRVRAAGGFVDLGPPFRLRIVGADADPREVGPDPYDVSFAAGAFLLFTREALDRLGGFRPDYFMYGEDVELCLRARGLGIQIVIVPAARVLHLPSTTAPVPPTLQFHMVKNLLATYALHLPLRTLPWVVLRYGVLEALRRMRGGWRQVGPFLRAWLWWLRHVPGLLRERRAQVPRPVPTVRISSSARRDSTA